MAQWDTAYINDLPDSAFAYIESGGQKDAAGKTVPRSLRHFPHHDSSGKPDPDHVRNALSRIPQSDLGSGAKASATAHVQAHANSLKIGTSALDAYERRTFPFRELRVEQRGDSAVIVGHAAVFNSLSEVLGGFIPFRELVMPGAFKKSLDSGADVRALFNHDPNYVLGRTASGTLKLSEDEQGLLSEITAPQTQIIRDLVLEPIRRGDINQMSFGFETMKDQWRTEQGADIRELHEVKLFDVSPVTFPAYSATDVNVRAIQRSLERHSIVDPAARSQEGQAAVGPRRLAGASADRLRRRLDLLIRDHRKE